jgi:RNA polymerase sigma factor (sigma-70 family)
MGDERPAAQTGVAELLRAAADGDQTAWNQLVERFKGLVWSICRSYGLNQADAADAFQLTWLRLLEHVDSIENPARLPGWLATTCRRECLGLLRRANRLSPTGDDAVFDRAAAPVPPADESLLISDRDAGLWRAFVRLSQRCQEILRLLVLEADQRPPSYELVAAALGMPKGSLGPTRGRCLQQLRKLLDIEGIHGFAADSD